MPTRTKLSNRKADLANHAVKPKSDPLDSANIVLDNKKLNSLAKSLPKIKKLKKEKVEVASSVTNTSCSGIKKESLEELFNPDDFLLNPDSTENQVNKLCEVRIRLILGNFLDRGYKKQNPR